MNQASKSAIGNPTMTKYVTNVTAHQIRKPRFEDAAALELFEESRGARWGCIRAFVRTHGRLDEESVRVARHRLDEPRPSRLISERLTDLPDDVTQAFMIAAAVAPDSAQELFVRDE